VEPWQEDQDLCPWPASDYDTGISAWKRQVGARQAQLAAELGAARQRERERTEAAAQAAQAAAEHQALLAAKSPEERAVANLGALLDRDQAAGRKEAGGELANALTLALKQAQAEWRGPVCQELADLAEAVYGFIGWPASKKKQERKALIQAVRDRA
jgi:hypothetical protein